MVRFRKFSFFSSPGAAVLFFLQKRKKRMGAQNVLAEKEKNGFKKRTIRCNKSQWCRWHCGSFQLIEGELEGIEEVRHKIVETRQVHLLQRRIGLLGSGFKLAVARL